MKITKLIFSLAASAMLLTGCGSKGSKTGTKTGFEEFLAAVDATQEEHPFEEASVSYKTNAMGQSYTFNGKLVCEEGYWRVKEGDLPDNVVVQVNTTCKDSRQQFIELNEYYEEEMEWYVNPISVKRSNESVTVISSYNEYGLFTYGKQEQTAYDASIEINVSYTKGAEPVTSESQGGISQSGAQPSGQKVTPQEFVDHFANSAVPYATAHMEVSVVTDVQGSGSQRQTGSANYTYDIEGRTWVYVDGQLPDSSLKELDQFTVEGYVGSFVEAGADTMGYTMECTLNPNVAHAHGQNIMGMGMDIDIVMNYDDYGCPTTMVQNQTFDGGSVVTNVTITYRK